TTATLGAAMLSLASIPGTAAAEISRRAAQCSLRGADFNGDQCGDLVVGDPGASVAGKAGAGRIHVVYGSEDGPGERGALEQGQPGVGDSPAPGDGFGGVLRTTDIDRDGISDLVVGVPSESVGGAEDAGVIHVIFGSAKGLGGGRPGIVL